MEQAKGGYTYITANKGGNVFYIGVTSGIVGRIWEHKEGIYENSFTKRYRVVNLVYFEHFDLIVDAIAREKELKGWSRERKISLIRHVNPEMKDLYTEEFIRDNS